MSRTKAEKRTHKIEKERIANAIRRAAEPTRQTRPPFPELTPEQQKKVFKLLLCFVEGEGCSFWMSRKFAGGTCAQENGRGFNCWKCETRYFLESIGVPVIDR